VSGEHSTELQLRVGLCPGLQFRLTQRQNRSVGRGQNCSVYNSMDSIIRTTIKQESAVLLLEEQHVFRKGRSCTDNKITLKQ